MTSSGSSTERSRPGGDSGFQPWHFYMLLSLAGATWAVIQARHTHPAALLLISAAVLCAGLVASAMHRAVAGFFGGTTGEAEVVSEQRRAFLEQEKALVLRSIKELEFDRAMGKIGDADFADLSGRLRGRAVEIMTELERAAERPRPAERRAQSRAADAHARPEPRAALTCGTCRTRNEPDARFCKSCGARLA
ncbi:MAG: zinc ribbon domain-containing protein [Acidobacteria bacterium]|nr:zinc ribbon domain-containing protein [Acidobacteriota bacterium]